MNTIDGLRPGWMIFVDNAWQAFDPTNPLPELRRGFWYTIEFVVDLTSNRYRQLEIRSWDDPTFLPVQRTLGAAVSGHFKGFLEESFVMRLEAENLWTASRRWCTAAAIAPAGRS